MSTDSDLVDLAESVFTDARSQGESGTGLDEDLWATLDRTGLARLTLPEAAGGSDATFDDVAAVLQAAGAHAARVPLAETDLLGGWLLHAAGLPVPHGPLTAVAADLDISGHGDDLRVSGTVARVPWARAVAGVALLAGDQVVLLGADRIAPAGEAGPGRAVLTPGVNLADEPRDTLVLDAVTLDASALRPAPVGAGGELRLRAALGRALLLAGAARGALARSVGYAGERVQFGRPISRFQAVQQQLALAAAEVAAAGAAASAAAAVAGRDGFDAESTAFAVAAAKSRTGEAAGEVARIAHQVHGAIGFTREHDLRLLTTRLWAWRDEDGSESHWEERLGATVLDAGPDQLWPLVTGAP